MMRRASRRIRSGFTDIDQSQFFWYKSLDKVVWKRIGKGYSYLLKKEDVDHYIKFVCVPYNKVKLKGPSCEVVSDSVVEVMGKLPTCPFEKRHRHTRHKLDGLR
ncbi:hypothetical protein NQ318_020005 [Aromia moschata]|uniref:Uncharacterized protein n=1 Tax=Aromia moschata TaxID=1265417 RepID=A0AAV8ZAC0_9CUCU|nr:hypothetical protein NQ318_020005 [Aromia moschata]